MKEPSQNFGPIVSYREDFVLEKDYSLVFHIQYLDPKTKK
jgi:hypothetical protein